jgi:[FeFe] hydrogenase H-cluster maturation GTPase HydF
MAKGRDAKPHIGIFGRRNKGKSSMINSLTGQEVAIVSEVAGTTTDPVKKSLEIPGIGPVILIDTAGIDDTGELGSMRIKKTEAIVEQIDLAILVIADNIFNNYETNLITKFRARELPYIVVHNKSDLYKANEVLRKGVRDETDQPLIEFSATQPERYFDALIERIRQTLPASALKRRGLLGDIVNYGDIVLLITPIDIEAPEGRLILPQVQTIRDILDNDCTAIVLKEREVDGFLKNTGIKPALVVTDSQVFLKADASIPRDTPLTSFSILLARQKGDFYAYLEGTPKISDLKDGDRILLLESCSHHVSCDDIGRIKIPRWISNFTGKKLYYDTVAGLDAVSRSIEEYALVIQCGGCMITHRQLVNRLQGAKQKNIPITNYGMAIAYIHGIFHRAVEPFVGKLEDQGDLI